MKEANCFTIVLGGEAGQGIQFIETLLVRIVKISGYHVFATKEYMSRIRGGINTTEISISSGRIRAHRDRIDLLFPLKDGVIEHLGSRVSSATLIVGDKKKIQGGTFVHAPLSDIASDLGNSIFANAVALGVICGFLEIDPDLVNDQIKTKLASKSLEIVENNLKAADKGFAIGKEIRKSNQGVPKIAPDRSVRDELLLTGADAVALGAFAGGCNAVFAYPMTPGTSLFTLMAGFSKEADILVEQVEDEIGVINMALGAWYAGARALVTTSGGGFALMTEGISLAGMIETPVVVHLAQRPGPATGLPTRTEQGDLNLALYSGHGEFPRIILAPGTIRQGFSLAAMAFSMADKYQVPVFILTDQYFVDTYYNVQDFDLQTIDDKRYIEKTGPDYQRYALTDNGLSPRGIPGYGTGRVCVDSDEHDETGRITEDLEGVRIPMADKRMRKTDQVMAGVLEPELIGSPKYKTLVLGWGSTYPGIREALEILENDTLAFLFCPQVYPVHKSVRGYLAAADHIIVVENNGSGQYADLIQLKTGIELKNRILKYNGMPFSVEELVERIGGSR